MHLLLSTCGVTWAAACRRALASRARLPAATHRCSAHAASCVTTRSESGCSAYQRTWRLYGCAATRCARSGRARPGPPPPAARLPATSSICRRMHARSAVPPRRGGGNRGSGRGSATKRAGSGKERSSSQAHPRGARARGAGGVAAASRWTARWCSTDTLRQKPEVQSTRPDSAARQALWTVAGCDAKMVQAECYRKGQPKTQNTRAPQRTSREWEEGDVQHEHIRSHVSYTLRPHVKRALELSLSDAPPRTKVPERGAGST